MNSFKSDLQPGVMTTKKRTNKNTRLRVNQLNKLHKIQMLKNKFKKSTTFLKSTLHARNSENEILIKSI